MHQSDSSFITRFEPETWGGRAENQGQSPIEGYNFNPDRNFVTKLIKIFIRMSAFKLSSEQLYKDQQTKVSTNRGEVSHTRQKEDVVIVRNFLEPLNPFSIIGHLVNLIKSHWSSPSSSSSSRAIVRPSARVCLLSLVDLFIFIFAGYAFTKFSTMSVLHYQLDLHLENDKPRVREGANRTEKCALRKDIYFLYKDYERHEKIEQSVEALSLFGDPAISITAVASVICQLLSVSILLYYYMSIILSRLRKIRVDFLSFLFNPKSEKLRIKQDLSGLVSELISSTLNYTGITENKLLLSENFNQVLCNQDYSSSCSSNNNNSNSNNEANGQQEEKTVESKIRMSSFRSPGSLRRDKNLKAASYVKVLLDSRLIKLVEPENLSLKWHKFHLVILRCLIILNFLVAFAVASGIFITMVACQLISIVNYRISLLECQMWHPNAVIISETHIKLPDLMSEYDPKIYLNYDGSKWDKLKLALEIESRAFFTPKVILCSLEILLVSLMSVSWVTLNLALYLSMSIDKLVWLKQIKRDIDHCTKLLSDYQESERSQSSSKFNKQPLDVSKRVILLKEISVAYLNFELFRRQQPSYQRFVNFMLTQATVQVSVTSILCYFVGSNLSSGYNTMLLCGVSYLVVALNLYLISGAILTNGIEKLMKSVTRLIAQGTQGSEKSSYVLELWRRQILCEKDTRKLFAPSVIGLYLSFETVMTFNFYLMAVWLVLLKVSR